jgi:hypothetical protein
MGLGHDHCHDLGLRLSRCMKGIFDRRSLGFFPVEMVQNSSPSSLVAHNNQNQYCAQLWDSCVDCHCHGVL